MAIRHFVTGGMPFCNGEIGWIITWGFGALTQDEEAAASTRRRRLAVIMG